MDSQSSIPSHISRWIPSCPVDSPQSYRLDRHRSGLILAHHRGTLTRVRRESSDPRTTSLYCTIPPPHPPSGSSNLERQVEVHSRRRKEMKRRVRVDILRMIARRCELERWTCRRDLVTCRSLEKREEKN